MRVPFQGRTRVLAFVRDWHPDRDRDELPAIRAELRGLGAVLVILSDVGAWSFQPDDDLERFDAASAWPALLAARFDAFRDTLLVIDGTEKVRFSHAGRIDGLLDALVAAGQALAAPATPFTLDRRELVIASLCTGFALVLLSCKGKAKDKAPAPIADEPEVAAPIEYDIVLEINGQKRSLKVDARVSLLDALRERLALPGTKKGCDHGQCGACTVHADDKRVNACLMLAVACQGKRIKTIEGLAQGDDLHPVQKAFVEHDGFQCGYCTPGQIMSAVALLAEGRAKTDDEVRELMSGNICRCGAYPNIVAAVQAARKGA
jgi:xanthine dehydrogenase YagT iron-sulfur-binding subunit